ncbi:PREDICTED: uncharacterized protein LOC105582077 [Cercocebus atys]|uniref:uncharacterized protein LOC105582077 n=1 Tax=Cercocebus atys TaxID=9531 RepID=UPI0005F4AA39|nr:PREDICTED: uncharacterized protein LOC105582077 [Cercocebus atys]
MRLTWPSPPPAPCTCSGGRSRGHLPSGKTKWSHAGESSMGWGKVARSRRRERKNRCYSEEDCRCSPGPGSLPRGRAARAPASWQRSPRRNHHSEAFCPLAAALPKTTGPPGGRDKPTRSLVFRERRMSVSPREMMFKIPARAPIPQLSINRPANGIVLPLGICKAWIFLRSLLCQVCLL